MRRALQPPSLQLHGSTPNIFSPMTPETSCALQNTEAAMEKIPTAHEDLIVRHANLLPVPAEFRDRLTTPSAPAQPAGRCSFPGCTLAPEPLAAP